MRQEAMDIDKELEITAINRSSNTTPAPTHVNPKASTRVKPNAPMRGDTPDFVSLNFNSLSLHQLNP